MSIDLTTIQAELSELLRVPVSLARADEYVKAFYKPPNELLRWAAEHREYSGKQLLALINCTQLKKKVRTLSRCPPHSPSAAAESETPPPRAPRAPRSARTSSERLTRCAAASSRAACRRAWRSRA